ncbi:MAG: peptidase M56 BlaR1 [Lachnospiraceae bacterium]|nr:peptidase M56 BlaR1 [Lachnospiraceae bacterium]
MNGEIFYWVLNMSIAGTVVGGVVWLLQRMLRLSKRLTFVLWFVPLVRLWLPFGAESKYSLMGLIRKVTVRPVEYMEQLQSEQYFTPFWAEMSMMNTIGAAESYFPIVYKQNVYRTIFGTAEAIWLIVALAAVLAGVAIYLSTAAELKSAKRIRDRVYRSDKVTSPMVFGVIRPRILLPEIPAIGAAGELTEVSGAEDEQSYVLLHEQTHIRRMDNLWRMIAVLTCCLHWFNPLIWLFLKQFLADMELACDEKVISICGEEKRKEYASALLDYEEQKTLFASAFGGAGIRVRIKEILSYRRLTVISAIGFLVLLAVIVITLLTNAAG